MGQRGFRRGRNRGCSAGLPREKLSSYISIERDGTVVAYYGKIDGGQGLETSVAQLVAEEVDVPWERVRVVMGDTGQCVNMGGATAGNGLRQGGIIMRQYGGRGASSAD
jgi:CO/xanthine dehydrogenase Mo-binding subunit